MAEKSNISANIAPYGLAIGNALSKSTTPIDELIALRDRARELIGIQGDLAAAVKALDAEIAGRAATKAAPRPPTSASSSSSRESLCPTRRGPGSSNRCRRW
jgi:hypothetical protein